MCFIIPACLSPFDVVCVSSVVSLQLLVHIEQDDHRGNEIHRFSGGQQVKVGATVSAAVTITGHSKCQGTKQESWTGGEQDRKLSQNAKHCNFSALSDSKLNIYGRWIELLRQQNDSNIFTLFFYVL